MANYLSGTGIQSVSQIGTGNLGSSSLIGNLGFNAALSFTGAGSAISPAIAALGGVSNTLAFLGLGGGSKPKALHTEYAAGDADWSKPYGSNTDIIFYLMRADEGSPAASDAPAGAGSGVLDNASGGGSPSTTGWPTNSGLGGSQPAVTSASVQTGPGIPIVQSPLNQVGVSTTMKTGPLSGQDVQNRGLSGPLTGLTPGLKVNAGGVSQTATFAEAQRVAITNITQAVGSFEENVVNRSLPASEKFFSQTLFKSYNPTESFSDVGSVDYIMSAVSRPSFNELSAELAKATGGVSSTADFIEGINYGRFGYSTPASKAQANRLGPQGLSQRKKQRT